MKTPSKNTPLKPYNFRINGIGVDPLLGISLGPGDIEFTWMSRNRFNKGGFSFTRSDTILDDEDFQKFVLNIYDGSLNLLRTVEQTSKTYNYTTALQTTDGGPFSIYYFVVFQRNTIADSKKDGFQLNIV